MYSFSFLEPYCCFFNILYFIFLSSTFASSSSDSEESDPDDSLALSCFSAASAAGSLPYPNCYFSNYLSYLRAL